MGRFDKLTVPAFTPAVALGTALIFMTVADGAPDRAGVETLRRVLGRGELLRASLRYARRHTFEAYLGECEALLDRPQKLCILLNVADLALRGGVLAPGEELRLEAFIKALGLAPDEVTAGLDALLAKNDLSVLGV